MVSIPSAYVGNVNTAAAATGLPVGVVAAQINEESGFQPGVSSPAGAEGIAQFLPSTWHGLGCSGSPFNAGDSFRCYATYMSQLLHQFHGNVRDALAAYNAGPGNLQAGYGYADTILRAAGQSPGITAAGGSGGGGGGVQQAQLDSFIPSPLNFLDPFEMIQAAAQSAGKAIATGIDHPASIAKSVATLSKDFNALASLANAGFTSFMWLLKPSHWIRIMAFGFGIMFLLPGVWMLSKAGQGEGDISLALGILLVSVGAVLLFIAFHNLPDDVKNLQDLLGWLSSEIRSNSPATTSLKGG